MIPSRAGKILIQQGHPIQVLMAFQPTPGGNGITSYQHLAFCLEDFRLYYARLCHEFRSSVVLFMIKMMVNRLSTEIKYCNVATSWKL